MILAITKILYMKEGKYGDPGRHLKHSLKYILDPEKTGGTLYTGSVNCQIPYAYEQMKAAKGSGRGIISSFLLKRVRLMLLRPMSS